MNAVPLHRAGGPEPAPKGGEVLIRIEADGLNFADVMRRRGDDYSDPSIVDVSQRGTAQAANNTTSASNLDFHPTG